ncbi:hypothetical protein J010_04030 [Cryptococcus neoformans]|uniref:Peptidase S9 prolyl oligopeptidase catalytic domain-containing protein n=1 Tax=Cryptococcus neoformans Tu259-1 TaxID=1230072 RepID=A0A854Q7V2_CRYNE|nr:hypothetical protein C353_04124 [Cryptococcus neoformans var. grubii AD1-83a]OWZ53272.1 hypothetical protein C368_04290 [Cryptococcus neoformans var. grubii 125.91]OXG18301.1 hypothetical protein C361_04424 [Cryptococcus neoformans var. grubii Tu259-1]OXG48790.1 hypothetical protein C355_03929 [Cryptococcus neoformans var. grubii Th84]OXG56524.1 hypothetical protein C354_04059 [Cryptococcus neoformans var. grubii MW-RSA1955]OXG60606.1 hypothetical protein C352_04060 [Cryptococcus neoformans
MFGGPPLARTIIPDSASPSGGSALHKMDYNMLALNHKEPSLTDLHISGLPIQVYGLHEVKESRRPLAVMIASHGRMNSKKHMKFFAQGILGELSKKNDKERLRDLIVVTFDQRNHGDRIVDKNSNLSFDENPKHLIDMAATIEGGCHDVSLIMDFLAPILFPNGEKTVESFVITGISLGGHVTWKLLHDDPRVQIGIPIIGLPFESFPIYLRDRALSQGFKWEPPLYPSSLKSFIEPERNPVVEQQKYSGKKILSLHGKEDRLVPYGKGERELRQIEKWVEEDKSQGGVCAIDVQDDVGHVCSIQMLRKAAEWTWIYALRA